MKKFFAIVLSAALLLLTAGCVKSNQNEDYKATAVLEETEKAADSNEKIDYESAEVEEWKYDISLKINAVGLLNEINTVEYGTAGSSFKLASAEYCVLELSNDDNAESALKAYLKNMNAIQKDYFSYNWDCAVSRTLLDFKDDGEKLKSTIEGFGSDLLENFKMENYSQEKVEELDEIVQAVFAEEGIQKEWKNLPEKYFY